jgi:hypothetical protein
MSETTKSPSAIPGVEGGSAPSGPEEPTTEALRRSSTATAGGEMGDIVTVLADIERFVTLNAEQARVQAARLAEAQRELLHVVSSVRDIANTAAGVTQKIRVGCLAAENDLHPVARSVILLARILRQINGLSKTTAATIQSQAAAARTLTGIVGEAAKASACLAGKVALLAGEARAVLPALSSKNLVEAELEWLGGELQKALTEFGRGSEGASEVSVDAITRELPANPQLIN